MGLPDHQAGLWNRIIAGVFMKWVTASEPPDGKPDPFPGAMFVDGLYGIFRARWNEPAIIKRKNWGE
jgi:hypothetical protein